MIRIVKSIDLHTLVCLTISIFCLNFSLRGNEIYYGEILEAVKINLLNKRDPFTCLFVI